MDYEFVASNAWIQIPQLKILNLYSPCYSYKEVYMYNNIPDKEIIKPTLRRVEKIYAVNPYYVIICYVILG